MATRDLAHDPISPARIAAALEADGIDLNERAFKAISGYLSGMSKSEACVAAGMPATATWSLFASRKVQAAMASVIDRFLVTDAAPAALKCLYDIVRDDKVAPGTRVTAANSLLDRGGFDSKRNAKDSTPADRDVASMTADELRAEITRLEQEQVDRMRDISPDGAPASEPRNSYLDDFA